MQVVSRILQGGFCIVSVNATRSQSSGITHTFIATGNCSCDELANVKGSMDA